MAQAVHRTPGETFAGYTDLTTIVCGVCGVTFAMPVVLQRKAAADHSVAFWCPNGCRLVYLGETEAEKLQRQLDAELRRVTRLRDDAARAAAERDQTKASLRTQKGVTTKLKKRIAAGVCPVPECHRSFSSLAEHIAKEHPEYAPSDD